jgi:hypothetical protein
MNTATVTVAFVNPPGEGKKFGNIKLDDGSYYSVSPTLLSQFQKGGKYEITYEEREYNGKMYRTAKTVKSLAAANGAAPPSAGGAKYGAHDPATSENIFVCGAVNAIISGMAPQEVTVGAIALLTNNLRLGWRRGLNPAAEISSGMAPKPAETAADMNDDIPF